MDITHHPGFEFLELRLTGRLDATWADHVSGTIEAAVKGGAHHIVLNFAGVDFISSLGIRVLLNHYKRLLAVKGSLAVSEPSDATLTILKAAGLSTLLLKSAAAAGTPTAAKSGATTVTHGGATYQVFPQSVVTPLTCTLVRRLPSALRRVSGGGWLRRDAAHEQPARAARLHHRGRHARASCPHSLRDRRQRGLSVHGEIRSHG